MTLFKVMLYQLIVSARFFQANIVLLSTVLLLASVLKVLENGFPSVIELPTDTPLQPEA